MKRFHQILLIASTMLASWLGMQAVHELGHVVAAVLSGGRVTRVVLHPLTIARTDLASNPHPLAVVWAGSLMGVIFPLLLWFTATQVRLSGSFVLRFFAGFCLIANGAYLGAGSFVLYGDPGDLVRLGSPIWCLWCFGVLTVPTGFWLWHRQGCHFRLGRSAVDVPPGVAYGSAVILVLLIALGLLLGR